MKKPKSNVTRIVGPAASGKTAKALELARAHLDRSPINEVLWFTDESGPGTLRYLRAEDGGRFHLRAASAQSAHQVLVGINSLFQEVGALLVVIENVTHLQYDAYDIGASAKFVQRLTRLPAIDFIVTYNVRQVGFRLGEISYPSGYALNDINTIDLTDKGART